MLKRRAKIKVRPVISAATNNSIQSDIIDEISEVKVAITIDETPVVNDGQQHQIREDLDDQLRINNDDIVNVEVQEGNINLLDDSIFEKLDQACLRLNSTINYESYEKSEAEEDFKAHENIPTFRDYVDIPITFEEDSRSESPISISTFVREEDIFDDVPPTNIPSISKDRLEDKRAAERLADRLVKRRMGERHRVRASGVLEEPVNSSRLCMRDLIYLNPKDNPMINTTVNEGSMILKEASESKMESKSDDVSVPQLEIGPDGNIKINEASLVIEQQVDDLNNLTVIDDTNYFFDGYKTKKPRSKKWGLKETKRFYAALSMIGTDFSLICKLFPNRTRDEVKNKFKSEDKRNRALIDTALKVKMPLDITLLAEPPSDDDLTDQKPPPSKKKTKNQKVKKKKEESTTKAPTQSKKKKLFHENSFDSSLSSIRGLKRKAGVLVSSGDDSDTEDEIVTSKNSRTKKRKVIEDDDSSTDLSTIRPVDPYEFTEEVEVVQAANKRPTRIQQQQLPDFPEEMPLQPIQLDESFKEKFSQQLQQIEADQRRSEMMIMVTEAFDDIVSSHKEREQCGGDDDDSPDDCFKLFNELPMKNKSNLNIVDHKDLNLEQLGVAEVPPNTKVVVVSTPFKDGDGEGQQQQQLLQIFLISEDSVSSVIEEIKNSDEDAINILLKMAQHHAVSYSGEVQGHQLLPKSYQGSDVALLNMMSPPIVQNEKFIDDELPDQMETTSDDLIDKIVNEVAVDELNCI